MLVLQVTNRTKLYFHLEEDTFPNKGGFFCRVYKDPNGEFPFADFTIDKRKLIGTDRVRTANKLAVAKIKALYNGVG